MANSKAKVENLQDDPGISSSARKYGSAKQTNKSTEKKISLQKRNLKTLPQSGDQGEHQQ